ncbi:predicted protein [Postia placenta Mad-698-R]|nr:predicted protein [Postia placenta Mad-698-R]
MTRPSSCSIQCLSRTYTAVSITLEKRGAKLPPSFKGPSNLDIAIVSQWPIIVFWPDLNRRSNSLGRVKTDDNINRAMKGPAAQGAPRTFDPLDMIRTNVHALWRATVPLNSGTWRFLVTHATFVRVQFNVVHPRQ